MGNVSTIGSSGTKMTSSGASMQRTTFLTLKFSWDTCLCGRLQVSGRVEFRVGSSRSWSDAARFGSSVRSKVGAGQIF